MSWHFSATAGLLESIIISIMKWQLPPNSQALLTQFGDILVLIRY